MTSPSKKSLDSTHTDTRSVVSESSKLSSLMLKLKKSKSEKSKPEKEAPKIHYESAATYLSLR